MKRGWQTTRRESKRVAEGKRIWNVPVDVTKATYNNKEWG